MARYYNPKHSVFLSVDPELSDDETVEMNNAYSYGANNPVMKYDSTGRWVWLIPAAAWGYRAYKGYKTYKKIKKVQRAYKIVRRAKPLYRSKPKPRYHGNSNRNMKSHHLYRIYDKRTNQTVKIGISGGKIARNGNSYRATRQINSWGRDRYGQKVIRKNIRGRARAKVWEQAAVNRYYRKGRLNMRSGKHKLPRPRHY